MNCREIQGYIFDRIIGEDVPGSVAEKLAEHLAGCPSCRRELEKAAAAWATLDALERITFPETLSRRVLETVGERPRSFRLLGRPLPPARLIWAAASLILAAGLLLLFSRYLPTGPRPVRSASTFSRSPIPGPDLAATLNGYLEESGKILAGLENGEYPTWGALLSEIISRDIQGRSSYLLENPELNPPARSVVEGLHQAFWTLLQNGRGREDQEIVIPPDLNPNILRGEIAYYQNRLSGKRRFSPRSRDK